MPKIRLINFDLLKLLTAFGLLGLSALEIGGALGAVKVNEGAFYFVWFFEVLSLVSVNCFVLLTSYFMTDGSYRVKKLALMWFQLLVANVLCYIAAVGLGVFKGTFKETIFAFFPLVTQKYPLMSAFFAFYIISPILAIIVNKLSEKQLKYTVLVLVSVFCIVPSDWIKIDGGQHLLWFVVLFFVASYIRQSDLFNKKAKSYLLSFCICIVLNFLCIILASLLKFKTLKYFTNYSFVLVFFASVALFLFFKNIKIKESYLTLKITKLSSLFFGIYFIQMSPYLKNWIWGSVVSIKSYLNSPKLLIYFPLGIIAVFTVSAAIEYVRGLLFKFFSVDEICSKAEAKINTIVETIFSLELEKKM